MLLTKQPCYIRTKNRFNEVFFSLFRIEDIPAPAFQDLHSLEDIKLANNNLKTLTYQLMEPVLDTLMHIDIHSEKSKYLMRIKYCTNLEPSNPSIDISELHKISSLADFEALKLRNYRSSIDNSELPTIVHTARSSTGF